MFCRWSGFAIQTIEYKDFSIRNNNESHPLDVCCYAVGPDPLVPSITHTNAKGRPQGAALSGRSYDYI